MSKKYTVSIEFWGTIESQSQEEAFNKVMEQLNCEALLKDMEVIGMTDIEHNHNEPEEAN